MQSQQQQTTQTPDPTQSARKPPRKVSLIFCIGGFSVTLLLLIITGAFYLRTTATSPSTLMGAFFTIIAAIFSLLQLVPILFPSKSVPPAVIQNIYHPSSNPTTAHIPHTPPPAAQPVFRYNMSLKYASEFYGRAGARTTLISRTASESCTSLVGERRMGKTWLMEYLQLIAPTHPNLGPRFRVGYLSATHPECETLVGFTMKALQTLKVPTSYLNQSQVQFSQLARAIVDLKNQGIVPVLCIDEFEGFSRQEFGKKFVEGLRAMAQDDGLVLITASKRPLAEVIMDMIGETSPLFNIIRKITLEPFTESEAQEFVQDKSGQAGFSDQERASFLKHATLYGPSGTQQWPPLRLQLVGQMLLDDKQIAQREGKPYQIDDIRYQLDFERCLTEEYQSVVKQQ